MNRRAKAWLAAWLADAMTLAMKRNALKRGQRGSVDLLLLLVLATFVLVAPAVPRSARTVIRVRRQPTTSATPHQ